MIYGRVNADDKIVQGIIEVVEEEVQEEDKEDTDETLTKPMAEGNC